MTHWYLHCNVVDDWNTQSHHGWIVWYSPTWSSNDPVLGEQQQEVLNNSKNAALMFIDQLGENSSLNESRSIALLYYTHPICVCQWYLWLCTYQPPYTSSNRYHLTLSNDEDFALIHIYALRNHFNFDRGQIFITQLPKLLAVKKSEDVSFDHWGFPFDYSIIMAQNATLSRGLWHFLNWHKAVLSLIRV